MGCAASVDARTAVAQTGTGSDHGNRQPEIRADSCETSTEEDVSSDLEAESQDGVRPAAQVAVDRRERVLSAHARSDNTHRSPSASETAPCTPKRPHVILLESYVGACSTGNFGKAWQLLSSSLQDAYSAEGNALRPEPMAGEKMAATKNGWDWPTERGVFKEMKIATYDGHMAVVHNTFQAGAHKVMWIDTVWTRQQNNENSTDARSREADGNGETIKGGAISSIECNTADGGGKLLITAMRGQCTATDVDRKLLVQSLLEDCSKGDPSQLWSAASVLLRRKWEAHIEKSNGAVKQQESGNDQSTAAEKQARRIKKTSTRDKKQLTVKAHCWSKYNWRQRGIYQGQKLMAWSEANSVAVVHCYFKQGSIEQVTFKETICVPNMLVTSARSECLAAEWQRQTAAEKFVDTVVTTPRSDVALWGALSVSLQQKYIHNAAAQPKKQGERWNSESEAAAEKAGVECCSRSHKWEQRGTFVASEVEKIENRAVVMRSAFALKGLAEPVQYLDRMAFSNGCLISARVEQCFATAAQSEELVRYVALQAVSGSLNFAELIFETLGPSLKAEYESEWIANSPEVQLGPVDLKEGATRICQDHFDWSSRARGAPGTSAGFRELVVQLTSSSHSSTSVNDVNNRSKFRAPDVDDKPTESNRYVVEARTRWDAGVTHILDFVDEFVVCCGWVVNHRHIAERTSCTIRSCNPNVAGRFDSSMKKLGFRPPTSPSERVVRGGEELPVVIATRRLCGLRLQYGLEEAGVPTAAALLGNEQPNCATNYLALDSARVAEGFFSLIANHKYEDAWHVCAESFRQHLRQHVAAGDGSEGSKLGSSTNCEGASTLKICPEFFRRFSWAGPVSRPGEGGRRGATMLACVAIDCQHSLVDASCDLTIRSEWGAKSHTAGSVSTSVWEDAITLCFEPLDGKLDGKRPFSHRSTGQLKVAGHLSLGLSEIQSMDVEGTTFPRLEPGWVVCAPRIPGPESEGVQTQRASRLSIRSDSKAHRIGSKQTGDLCVDEGGVLGQRASFVSARVPRYELGDVKVEHSVELFETRLVRRDAVPPGFSSIAGHSPDLTLEESQRYLHNPIAAHARNLQAVLEDRGGVRNQDESDVFYAVRLREVLAELVAAKPENDCIQLDAEREPNHDTYNKFRVWKRQRDMAFKFRNCIGECADQAVVEETASPSETEQPMPSKLEYAATYATGLRLGGVPARLLFGTQGDKHGNKLVQEDCWFGHSSFCVLVDVFLTGVGWVQVGDPADTHPGTFGCTFGDTLVWSSWPQAQQATTDLLSLRPTHSAEGGCDRLFRPMHAVGQDPHANAKKRHTLPRHVVDHTPITLARQLLPLVSYVSSDPLFDYINASIVDQLHEAAKTKTKEQTGEELEAAPRATSVKVGSDCCRAESVKHEDLLELCREKGGSAVLGQLFSHCSTLQLPLGVRAILDPHQDTEFTHVLPQPSSDDPTSCHFPSRQLVDGDDRHPVVYVSLKKVQVW